MDLWHTLFVIWYIENGISYKASLDIWRIEIIFLFCTRNRKAMEKKESWNVENEV